MSPWDVFKRYWYYNGITDESYLRRLYKEHLAREREAEKRAMRQVLEGETEE